MEGGLLEELVGCVVGCDQCAVDLVRAKPVTGNVGLVVLDDFDPWDCGKMARGVAVGRRGKGEHAVVGERFGRLEQDRKSLRHTATSVARGADN